MKIYTLIFGWEKMEALGLIGKSGNRISNFVLLFFLLSYFIVTPVYAKENTDTVISANDREDVFVLYGEAESYEVQNGDSLWKIADMYLGDGARYTELLMSNEAFTSDPNLIYPGIVLQIAKEVQIPRLGSSSSGASSEYRFAMPSGWTVGFLGDDDIGANYVWFGNGLESLLCLIKDKEESVENTVANWERVQEKIQSYAKEKYEDSVSNLVFEKYYTADNEEVCFYTYQYTLDFADYGESGTMDLQVCVGIKLTDRISAQFIGYTSHAANDDIVDVVKSVTASFEETAKAGEALHINDSNMSIWPDSTWELEGLYDPFPWVAGYLDKLAQETIDTWSSLEEDQDESDDRQTKGTERIDRVLQLKKSISDSGNQ